MTPRTVLKFGGTSMGDERSWRSVMEIIARYERPWVVVSATARTTRKLHAAAEAAVADQPGAFSIAEKIESRHQDLVGALMESLGDSAKGDGEMCRSDCEIIIDDLMRTLADHIDRIHEAGQLNPARRDAVAAIGEQLSSRLFARCAPAAGLNTRWVDAGRIIRTDSGYGSAAPDTAAIRSAVESVVQELPEDVIPVMGGYYGTGPEGELTTLGFEGSDYSASLVGASLPCRAVEIWTDVSGVYTCDPRIVENARPIPALSFREATELAWFGAKVLHPSTLKPASTQDIPVLVKNIFRPDDPGTRISRQSTGDGLVKAMAGKENSALLAVTSSSTVMGYDFLSSVFSALREHRLPVDIVTTTEASVSVALDYHPVLDELVTELNGLGEAKLSTGLAVIGLVGCEPSRQNELLVRIREALEEIPVETLSYSRTKRNLNLVIPSGRCREAMRLLHRSLLEEGSPRSG